MSFGNSASTQSVSTVQLNAAFLSKIFGDKGEGAVFSTNQHYNYIPFPELDSDDPNYYAICKVTGNRRKNENFTGMYLIVCDDVGTKAAAPPLKPSYVIETSPNNFQWGYRLDTPVTDIGKAKALINVLINSGYTDPGAHGIVRLVRLPSGTNLKNGFNPRLTTPLEDLDIVYTYSQLMGMLSCGINNGSNPISNESYEPYEVPETISQGSRNTQMTQLFGHYLSIHSVDVAVLKLEHYNETRCIPPLDGSEMQTIITSISNKEAAKYGKFIENIYHVRNTDTWYDFNLGEELTANSLNITYKKEFPGGKGNLPKITNWLPEQPGFHQVAGFLWSPVPVCVDVPRTVTVNGLTYINTYRNIPTVPASGDIKPWLELTEYLIPDVAEREAVIKWMACRVKYPDQKPNWQIVHRGAHRVGKDSMYMPLMRIMGHLAKGVSQETAKQDRNGYMAQKSLLLFHELYKPGDKAYANQIKILAASTGDPMMHVNPKCEKDFWQVDVIGFIAMSNHRNCLAAHKDDDRYLVIDSYLPRKDDAYYNAYYQWLDSVGAISAVYSHLLSIDVSVSYMKTLPIKTAAAVDMSRQSASEYSVFLIEAMDEEDGPFSKITFTTQDVKDYLEDYKYKSFSDKGISETLEENGYPKYRGQKKGQKATPMFYSNHPSYVDASSAQIWTLYHQHNGKNKLTVV